MYRWARMVAVCALVLASAGCLRYHAQLRVDAAGTVSGQLIVAVRQDVVTGTPQHYDVPAAVRDKVTVTPYDSDGYVGDTLNFDRLTLDEVGVLFAGGQRDGAIVQLDMTRSGREVSLRGTVFFPDTSGLGGRDGFDARIELSFAGATAVTANGTVAGQDVTWTPRPGELLTLTAQATYPPEQPVAAVAALERRPIPAIALLAGLSALLAGVVVLLLLLVRLRRRRLAWARSAEEPAGVVPPGSGVPARNTLPLPTVPLPEFTSREYMWPERTSAERSASEFTPAERSASERSPADFTSRESPDRVPVPDIPPPAGPRWPNSPDRPGW